MDLKVKVRKMIEKKLDQITEEDLLSLKENEVLEGKTIEYKRELNLDIRDDRKEFLADVSSFANAIGGDLIIGITEDNGIPDVIEGLEREILDNLEGKIEGLLRDGTEPRVHVEIQEVPLSNSKFALIIRIPNSWKSPHRVLMRDNNFYSRNSNGKYRLDIEELRNAFNLSETLAEKVKSFREDRLSKIYANDAPISLNDDAKTIIHIIPINAFNPGQIYELDQINQTNLKLIRGTTRETRYNLDGIIAYNSDAVINYVQLFRNGIIEAVDEDLTNPNYNGLVIPSGLYEPALMKAIKSYLIILESLNVETPVFIFISLIGVKGYTLATNTLAFKLPQRRKHHLIDRDVVLLPETIIQDYDDEIEQLLKPSFDSLWNACGYASSPNYNENGEWEPSNKN